MLRHLHDKKAVLHALGWIFMTSANSFAPRAEARARLSDGIGKCGGGTLLELALESTRPNIRSYLPVTSRKDPRCSLVASPFVVYHSGEVGIVTFTNRACARWWGRLAKGGQQSHACTKMC